MEYGAILSEQRDERHSTNSVCGALPNLRNLWIAQNFRLTEL